MTLIMIISTLLEDPPSAPAALARSGANHSSDSDHDLDAMTRGLASEFPLHSMSELRRTISAAEGDLWPRKDRIDILDRARERLREGVIS